MLEGQQGEGSRILCVVHTRPYPTAQLLQTLIQHGWSAIDRPYDSTVTEVLEVLRPVGVVFIGELSAAPDRAMVREVRHAFDGFIVAVGPGPGSMGYAETLESGADVCIHERDGMELLVAQLAAFQRRTAGPGEVAASALKIGEIRIDFNRCEVWRGEDLVPLSPLEFKVFAFLGENAGRVLSPREILSAIHDYSYSEGEARNVVKVYIRRIRKKIQDEGGRSYIVNARGFGYMLDRRVARLDAGAQAKVGS